MKGWGKVLKSLGYIIVSLGWEEGRVDRHGTGEFKMVEGEGERERRTRTRRDRVVVSVWNQITF